MLFDNIIYSFIYFDWLLCDYISEKDYQKNFITLYTFYIKLTSNSLYANCILINFNREA